MRVGRGWLAGAVLVGVALSGVVGAAGVDLGLLEPSELLETAADRVILDARPRRQWQAGHLPGAHSFPWQEHTGTDAVGVPDQAHLPGRLAAELGRLGIGETTAVAVYGDADTSWGGEGWVCWVFAWLGHRGPVRLLAGGVQSWQAAGLPLSRDASAPGPVATYRIQLRPEVLRTVEQVEKVGQGEDTGSTLVDTRSTWEWLSGHLPGAVHLPWKDLYAGPERRPLDPVAYQTLLAERGLDPAGFLVFYCTGGVRSAYAWTVHHLATGGPAANFEGGMEAWQRRPGGKGGR
ncbi:MAG TPA: rhodanese-like domain-containing protein [Deferrisomatales bacterium]|nr:rhodanese-like domain-containing protein [Deferrisomatales bacterium]